MQEFLNILMAQLDYVLLLMLRVSALIVSSPLFGRRNVPARAKIGLCLFLTLFLLALYPPGGELVYGGVLEYVFLCAKELLIGLIIGYVTTLFFNLAFTAGHIIDMQIGFGMVNIFDVQQNIQVPVTGNLLNLGLLLMFFGVGGHHKLFYMLFSTLERVPVGAAAFSPQMGVVALDIFAKCFVLSLQLSMPLIAAGLIEEAALGVLIRTVPQMNMYVVGIPVKIALGFVLLLLIMPAYIHFTGTVFNEMFLGVGRMFETLLGTV